MLGFAPLGPQSTRQPAVGGVDGVWEQSSVFPGRQPAFSLYLWVSHGLFQISHAQAGELFQLLRE